MPIQSTDTDRLVFTAPNQQWIVKQGVTIANAADNRDAVTMGFAGVQLLNHGDISSTGGGVFGAAAIIVGAEATIVNGRTGSVFGPIPISIRADSVRLHNEGSITSLDGTAVSLANFVKDFELVNTGDIWGRDAGIAGYAVLAPTITNSGTIQSDGTAILLDFAGGTGRVVNTGTIVGKGGAIAASDFGALSIANEGKIVGDITIETFEAASIVNGGTIRGDITLSGRPDTYDGRGGTVTGTVFGGNGEDTLRGGRDEDIFYGGKQEDRLTGGGGDDTLVGGDRADRLKGGSGDDTFVYENLSDSKGGFFARTERDTIVDFRDGDRIDLRPIDAKIGDGNQKFKFIGTADFSGAKGELRYFKDGGDAFVQADVTGDRKADMEIKLNDVSKLDAGDFYL